MIYLLLQGRKIENRLRRKNLPGNLGVNRTQTIGLRKKYTTNKKIRFPLANTPTQDRAWEKKLIDEWIKQVPNLYRFRKSKIANKNIQWALNSDIALWKKHRTKQKIN